MAQVSDTHPIVGVKRGDEKEVSRQLIKKNQNLFQERISAEKFKELSLSTKAVFAFSGIGELGERHYQALEYNRLLICENLDYLESIFNFQSDTNYIKIDDELKDLNKQTALAVKNENKSRKITQQGHEDYIKTYEDPHYIFKKYFLDHLSQ